MLCRMVDPGTYFRPYVNEAVHKRTTLAEHRRVNLLSHAWDETDNQTIPMAQCSPKWTRRTEPALVLEGRETKVMNPHTIDEHRSARGAWSWNLRSERSTSSAAL